LPISWNKNIIIIFWPIDENESIRLSLFWFYCDILKVFTVICFIPIHLNRALVWSWWIPSKWNVKICSWNSGIWWRWECYDTTFKISHPQKDKAILPQPKTSRTYQSKPREETGEEIYHYKEPTNHGAIALFFCNVNIIILRAWIIMSNIDIIDHTFYIFLSFFLYFFLLPRLRFSWPTQRFEY